MNNDILLFNIGDFVVIDLDFFKDFILNNNISFLNDSFVFCFDININMGSDEFEEEDVFRITDSNIEDIISFIEQIGNFWYIEDIIDIEDNISEESSSYTIALISNKNCPDLLIRIPVVFLNSVSDSINNFNNNSSELYTNILNKMTDIICQHIIDNNDLSELNFLEKDCLDDLNIDFDSIEETFDENDDMYY